MKVLESQLRNEIQHTHILKAGPVFVFDSFLITEFYEGVVVDYDCFKEIYALLDTYSQNIPDFGFLSNRVYSYSVKATDFVALQKERLTSKTYHCAVVTYDTAGLQMFSFEQKIYGCKAEVFTGLESAMKWLANQRSIAC